MKIRLNVRSEVYDALAAELAAHGIELSYDAQLMLSEVNEYPVCVSGKVGGESYHIAVSKAAWIESLGHDVIIHAECVAYKTADRLWQLEKSLDPKQFLRISNSVIVARGEIQKIRASLSSKFVLTLTDGAEVTVTRSYYQMFKAQLGI